MVPNPTISRVKQDKETKPTGQDFAFHYEGSFLCICPSFLSPLLSGIPLINAFKCGASAMGPSILRGRRRYMCKCMYL